MTMSHDNPCQAKTLDEKQEIVDGVERIRLRAKERQAGQAELALGCQPAEVQPLTANVGLPGKTAEWGQARTRQAIASS